MAQIRLSSFEVQSEKIILLFCDSLKSKVRVLVSKKEREGGDYKTLIDVRSISLLLERTISFEGDIPPGFDAKVWSSVKIEDGEYRIFIASDYSCGEIKFIIKNGIRSNVIFFCLIDGCL
jgi:hypothetical protein